MFVRYTKLGRTGLEVSELCYGTLILGAIQADVPVEEGARAIRQALDHGVNFFDTAQVYQTYGHLREGLRGVESAGGRPLVVASKTFAKTAAEAREALEDGLRQLGRERFDIFMLHNVGDSEDFAARAEALDYLRQAKAEGLIGHLGVSTHCVSGVRAALAVPDLEVILPILNQAGRGLRQGTMPEMVEASREAYAAGRGVFAMKALAGGHLGHDFLAALTWVRNLGCVHSVAVGMKSAAEVEVDVAVFEGRPVPADAGESFYREKRILVNSACTGCGSCAGVCPAAAITVADGRASCDHSLCVSCGYCGQACPSFAIRLV